MIYKITLNGRTYEVEVEAEKAMLLSEYEAIAPVTAPAAPAVPAASAAETASTPAAPVATSNFDGTPVCAPIPGTILKVNVTVGQTVNAEDVLCILEAMKMENEIKAPKAGKITQVLVSKGVAAETGTPLIVIG